MLNKEDIKQKFPLSFSELESFFESKYGNKAHLQLYQILDLPFEFQLGLWLLFFQSNAIDMDIQSMQLDDMEASLEDSLQILENSINHYS